MRKHGHWLNGFHLPKSATCKHCTRRHLADPVGTHHRGKTNWRIRLGHEMVGDVYPALAVSTFINIMSARWFTRAWSSHEVQMCKNCMFLVPAETGILQLQFEAIHDLHLAPQRLAANSEVLGMRIL